MPKGLWIWPSDPRGQRATLRKVAASTHLMDALKAIAKSKEGMSDSELPDAISDSSEWTTLWVMRQLTALGFIEYKVDLFGNPARYHITEQGLAAFSTITGQPLPRPAPPPAAPTQPRPQQAAPNLPTPQPPPSKAA